MKELSPISALSTSHLPFIYPCDELSPEDGRRTDKEYHKGKWGHHKTNAQLERETLLNNFAELRRLEDK